MKTTIITVVLALFAISSFAQVQKVECAMAGYLTALKSENDGLRHDALFQLAKLKAICPHKEFCRCMNELKRISQKDKNPLIRLHALMTIEYVQKVELQKTIDVMQYEDYLDFYNAVYTWINKDFVIACNHN
ncbi:hypothetical protein JW964_04090 [candidate division KSB1 bacterium]|nr:hypothetical protein [candidate division KSB1 bacterium]